MTFLAYETKEYSYLDQDHRHADVTHGKELRQFLALAYLAKALTQPFPRPDARVLLHPERGRVLSAGGPVSK